jgi:hypothetical protein
MTPARHSNPASSTATGELRPHAGIPSLSTVGIAPKQRSVTLWVAAVWLCFLIRAVFYSSVMPVWEGYDESSHFDFVAYLASEHKLPETRSATGSRAVADSVQLAPVPWTNRAGSASEIPHDEFWKLPEQDRLARDRALRLIEGDRPRNPVEHTELAGRPLYEAQQPPLAYLVFLPAFLIFRHASLLTQAWILRITGSLIASLVIPLGFLIGRKVFRNDWQAIGLTALISAMPELMILVTHAGNEPLSLAAGSACIHCLILLTEDSSPLRHAVMTGIVLGCALLTKAYFLVLIPPVFAICGLMWLREPDRRSEIARQLGLTLGLIVMIAGWWYARTLSVTGTLTGQSTDIGAQGSSVSMLQALTRMSWLRAADFALTTHVWLGGWSFLVLRGWMYRVVAAILAAAFIGMVIARKKRAPLLICGGVALFFWIVPAYHALEGFRMNGRSETMGYYAYCVIAAEAVCLIAGIGALLPKAASRFAYPGLITIFAAIDLYGMVFMSMPYYAGLIAHSARGSVPALHLGQLANGGIDQVFRNLALCKPWFLPPIALIVLFTGYIVATGGVIAMGFLSSFLSSARTRNDSATAP